MARSTSLLSSTDPVFGPAASLTQHRCCSPPSPPAGAGAHQRPCSRQRLRDHPAGGPCGGTALPEEMQHACACACLLNAAQHRLSNERIAPLLTSACCCCCLQGFNWESCKEPWYRKLTSQVGAGWVRLTSMCCYCVRRWRQRGMSCHLSWLIWQLDGAWRVATVH